MTRPALNDLSWLSEIPRSWDHLGRALTPEERGALETQDCSSENWEKIRVAQNFTGANYVGAQFSGHCYLENQQGTLEHEGMTFPCGVKNVRLENVFCSSNIHIERCSRLSDVFLSKHVILHDVAIIRGYKKGWASDRTLEIGNELGGRVLSICPEMTLAMAQTLLEKKPLSNTELQKMNWHHDTRREFSVLGESVVILSCPRLSDVCLSPYTIVDRALEVSETVTLSGHEEPVTFGPGTQLHRAFVQWGSTVKGSAQCHDVVLAEQSLVSHGAMVEQAYLGPNTQVGKGEVTASLLGPFVAMHHQSLIIGVIWPEGLGNVGYGANVGSNHTGKAPDQEFFPGEGCFLGLSCAIKFPTNFTASPYSMVSTSVTTLPQRLEMPFSLINSRSEMREGVSPALNELMPAWVLGENLYALIRNELKYQKRNKAKRFRVESRWLRPQIALWMSQSRNGLTSLGGKAWYDGTDSPALGKNTLSEAWRIRGIGLYDRFLAHYACDQLLKEAPKEPSTKTMTETKANELIPSWLAPLGLYSTDMTSLAQWWLGDLAQQVQEVAESKNRDFSRGRRIIDDYDDAHAPLIDDPVIALAKQRWEAGYTRVKSLLPSTFSAPEGYGLEALMASLEKPQ
jgi:hypothetical protein